MSNPNITSKTSNTHRPDGRKGGASLRPLACEVSCLNRPDGSAQFTSGSTQVLAAVYGPAAPRQISKEHPHQAILAIVFKQSYHGGDHTSSGSSGSSGNGGNNNSKRKGGGGVHMMTEREMEKFIGEALSACVCLEMYPRCVIEIVIQVMKADGSVIGTALNAAVVALLDAGIQMTSIPIATTCLLDWNTAASVTNDNDNDDDLKSSSSQLLKLDPVAEEELSDNCSVIVLVTDSVQSQQKEDDGIISSITLGTFTPDSYLSCITAASKASQAVLAFMRLAIEQKCIRESQTLWSN